MLLNLHVPDCSNRAKYEADVCVSAPQTRQTYLTPKGNIAAQQRLSAFIDSIAPHTSFPGSLNICCVEAENSSFLFFSFHIPGSRLQHRSSPPETIPGGRGGYQNLASGNRALRGTSVGIDTAIHPCTCAFIPLWVQNGKRHGALTAAPRVRRLRNKTLCGGRNFCSSFLWLILCLFHNKA